MLAPEHPFAKLSALADGHATGELIATSTGGETHVFLHRGRVAWATDSRRPNAFARHLQSVGIGGEVLREVTEECRRGRLPLVETLVAWGLATAEDLRAALQQQLREMLELLRVDDRGQTLFLARDWPSYDSSLTFDVDDLVATAAHDELQVRSRLLGPELGPGLAQRVRARVDGLTWVELLERDRIVECEPSSDEPRTPAEVLAALSDGAELVAVQSDSECLLGIAIADSRTLWCRCDASTRLGSIFAPLAMLTGFADASSRAATPTTGAAAWSSGDPSSPWAATLDAFTARAHEVLAALVLDASGRAVAAVGRAPLDPQRCIELANRRRPAIVVEPHGTAASRAMVSAEGSTWCFGTRLDDGHTGWILLDRSTAQGLGWTYLSVLSRSRTTAAKS